MKPVKLVILCSVLALAGCGNNDNADTAADDERMLGQPAETPGDATDTGPGATNEPGGMSGDMSGDSSTPGTIEEPAPMTDDTMGATPAPADPMAEAAPSPDAATGDAATATDPAADGEMPPTTEGAAPEAAAPAGDAAAPAADASGADLAMGQTVYQGKCQACHATGAAGAPKLDDKANWEPRIAQGMDVLVKHSLEGFKGNVGFMPPKGGFASLSDEEVAAAVAYMVSQAQ